MKPHLALAIAATFLINSAHAAEPMPKARYESAKSAASSRYADDKKLCAEASSSGTRMQCLRDAKAEYDKALAKAKAEYDKVLTKAKTEQASASASSDKACAGCGKVLLVNVVEKAGEGSPVGMVAGGVAGALLGNQVGKGTGRDIATIAGAAGGAYAGHKIEQKIKSVKKWVVAVRFDNGDEKTFNFDKDPGFTSGAAVKASNGSIIRR